MGGVERGFVERFEVALSGMGFDPESAEQFVKGSPGERQMVGRAIDVPFPVEVGVLFLMAGGIEDCRLQVVQFPVY